MDEYFSLRILSFDYYILDIENDSSFINKSVREYLLKCPEIDFIEFYRKENKTDSINESFNKFMNRKIKKIVVLRIFGSTYRGQKCCLNIHNYFPYFYVEISEENHFDLENTQILRNFAEILERASIEYANRKETNNIKTGKINNLKSHKFHEHVIHNIEIVEKLNFYGYYKKSNNFLKIFVYQPKFIPILMDILNNGAINGKKYQCYEAHLSLCMHFFSDFNLYGMNLIKFNKFSLRYYLPNELVLRNDIENFNHKHFFNFNNLCHEEIFNFLKTPKNMIWNGYDCYISKFSSKELSKSQDELDYESLIKFSNDLKIWDFDRIKKKHGKVVFNNMR